MTMDSILIMRCPICPDYPLKPTKFETDLLLHKCSSCTGTWIQGTDYQNWISRRKEGSSARDVGELALEVNDVVDAKLCSNCNRIMLKYRIGHGIGFSFDFCRACNGVWFDKNEWETLVAKALHDDIHSMVTDHWQNSLRREEIARNLERLFRNKFGEDGYRTVSEFWDWLKGRADRGAILAYLADEDLRSR